MKKGAVAPLSSEMERYIIRAVIDGDVADDLVKQEEVSKEARYILKALSHLKEAKCEITPKAILLTASEVLGADSDSIRGYIKALPSSAEAAGDILGKVQDRRFLVDLVNAVGVQLTDGTLDVGALTEMLCTYTREKPGALEAVGEDIKNGIPDLPRGVELKTLPTLNEKCGGFRGIWSLCGEPAAGKSALAWQMILDIGRELPILLYDFENGLPTIMHRTAKVFGNDLDKLRDLTKRVYYRGSIRNFDADLAKVPPPAVIVVDSVQSLPRSTQFSMEGLNRWIFRFEALKKAGYSILLISEVPKSAYNGEPSLGDFKETGEIEYKSDIAARLLPEGVFYVVKNRHYPFRGRIMDLERVKSWWFKERSYREEG